jgi:hypothetical protein
MDPQSVNNENPDGFCKFWNSLVSRWILNHPGINCWMYFIYGEKVTNSMFFSWNFFQVWAWM